jgi:hypothetical protein
MINNSHIFQSLAQERATEFHARAAASHIAVEGRSERMPDQPTVQPQPVETARHDLIPAGAPER